MSARLRVVIADDERPARSFLGALLRSFDDVVVVAEAASGLEAVAAIERERPDIVFFFMYSDELDPKFLEELKKYTVSVAWFADDSWRFYKALVFWLYSPLRKLKISRSSAPSTSDNPRTLMP